jgi:hypothetical protein
VTAPALPATTRLAVVAGWDVGLLARAESTLRAVAERLPVWRARLEGVARSLDDGASWSGPAARSTAGAARELSGVTWTVEGALADSAGGFRRLALEADRAQDLARQALVALDRRSTASVEATAEAALAHAAAVAAAAEEAAEALVRVGVRDAFVPADLGSAAARFPAPVVGAAPSGPPEAVAAWWAALPLPVQLAALRADPAGLGGRDGLPAWARDRANRVLLADALADPTTEPYAAFTARVVAGRIAEEEAAGRPVQLHLLDLAGDRVALGYGDLDGADAVAVLVPGIWNTPGDDLGALLADARAVTAAAATAAPTVAVAALVWLGYDSPSTGLQIIVRRNASTGGAGLALALDGLRTGREAVVAPGARTTVVAHSYGTVVVDEAADVPGRLGADAVVLLGSPGMEQDAAALEAPEVYDAAAPDDPVVALRWFGRSTDDERFGSTALPVGAGTGHSGYLDPDRPTAVAIGRVVAGASPPR